MKKEKDLFRSRSTMNLMTPVAEEVSPRSISAYQSYRVNKMKAKKKKKKATEKVAS